MQTRAALINQQKETWYPNYLLVEPILKMTLVYMHQKANEERRPKKINRKKIFPSLSLNIIVFSTKFILDFKVKSNLKHFRSFFNLSFPILLFLLLLHLWYLFSIKSTGLQNYLQFCNQRGTSSISFLTKYNQSCNPFFCLCLLY